MVSNSPDPEQATVSHPDAYRHIKVEGIKELRNKVLQVTLTFKTSEFGKLTIRGYRVSPSIEYDGYWVQPPRVPVYKNYFDLCRTEGDVWEQIQQLLISVYKERFSVVDEKTVDLDDIDIGNEAST